MTKAEVLKIIKMHLDGATLQTIADEMDTTPSTVYKICSTPLIDIDRRVSKCAYPGLHSWMRKNKCTRADLAEMLGISYDTVCGRLKECGRGFSIQEVMTILEFTGLTFEEAFGKEEEHQCLDGDMYD